MAGIKLTYSSPTSIACTLSGLATGSARNSASVDNTSNGYIDVLIEWKFVYPNSAPTGGVGVFVVGSVDGTTWPDGVTGTDAANTGANPVQAVWPGFAGPNNITPIQNGTQVYNFNLSYDFLAVWPFWSVVVDNQSGFTLSAGSGVRYIGITPTIV